MNRELATRWARRGVVLVATGAVLGVGVMTVQVAADWRAASASLDTVPVSLAAVSDDYVAETDRTAELSGQVDAVASQIADLKIALATANGSLTGDEANATALQVKLDGATAKLKTLQKQLKGAQARLSALNRAAARQAALNRQAAARAATTSRSTSSSTSASSGGQHEHEGEDDD